MTNYESKCGTKHCDIDTDAIVDIECAVENKSFANDNVGTYVINLTEVKRDTAIMLSSLENNKTV